MLNVGITSAGSGVGSAVLRSLALSALKTCVITLDSAPDAPGIHRGHRSRLIPRAQAADYQERVLRVCAEEGIQVLIPGLDTELEPLSLIQADLAARGCHLLCAGTRPIRLLRDKLACSEFFRARNLPFVHTLPLSRVDEMVAEHGFPLLVKPLGGSASRGVHILFDAQELAKLRDDAATLEGEPYIVQNYLIPTAWGRTRRELRHSDVISNHSLVQRDEHMCQVLVDADGSPFGVMLSRNSLKDGAISRMQPLERDEGGVIPVALAMARHLAEMGLVGPCNFQSRVTEEGPFVYEVNPRFSGGTGGRACLGFNEVEACIRRLVLGEGLESLAGCLATVPGKVCAWHPMELVMDMATFPALQEGRAVPGPLA